MPTDGSPDDGPQSPGTGLTADQVRRRVEAGLVNRVPTSPSRTNREIIRANVLTRFNALMGALLVVVLACGAFRDALFGGVIVANSIIGIIQELRAKRTLDRLAVLSAPRVQVVRDGEVVALGVEELVLDDVIELGSGRQVVADAIVLEASGLEVDESLLTGEADPDPKSEGDELFSGSFVVAGTGRARVTKVGADSYAARLAEEARRFTLVSSELRTSIDTIVKWVSWALIPAGAALITSQLRDGAGIRKALVSATGGVVAMVPEGLVLLTSVAFAVGVVRLARRRTLVRELPAIETLARVDVVCLDKTGTITEGTMTVAEVVAVPGTTVDLAVALDALAASSADGDANPTQDAIRRHRPGVPDGWTRTGGVAFSSARKWSAASFDGRGTWVTGAPELVLGDRFDAVAGQVGAAAAAGQRVLVLARTDAPVDGDALPPGLEAVALVFIEDTIREDAAETLAYFAAQGVTLKVISGDNPDTVAAVAARAGLADAANLIDARRLPEDDEAFADAVEATTVFGRVNPHQKQAMVRALQSRGHVVAMTGDGVNDVLALKDADCGIAMASGSEATRAVAQLVLLDSNFAGLPRVVLEGRRVINNLERVAALFLTKTTYAVAFAVIIGISGITYPFLPRHLTLIGTMTIGVPSFFLALAPNDERVRGNFFGRVARVAVPAGCISAAATLVGYVAARRDGSLALTQQQTTATLVLVGCSLVVLILTSRPFVVWKGLLVAAMGAIVLGAVVTPFGRDYFALKLPSTPLMGLVVALVGLAAVGMVIADRTISRRGGDADGSP